MNKLQQGIVGALTGIVLGTMLTTMVDAFAKDGTLPSYFVLLFGLVSVIGNIVTIKYFQYAGVLYTIGWLIGSLIMRDILSPVDIVFNIAAPIVILILRAYFWVKNPSSNSID